MFELGFTQLGIVGAAVLAVGLYVMAEHDKYSGLWITYVGLVVIGGGVAFHFHKTFADSDRHRPAEEADRPDRAWISLSTFRLIPPLRYDNAGWDAGKRWYARFIYQLKNTGGSPATNVSFWASMRPFIITHLPPGQIEVAKITGTNTSEELKAFCSGIEKGMANSPFNTGGTIFKDEIKGGTYQINGNPALFDAAKSSPNFSGNILVMVCVSYRIQGSEKVRVTGEAFQLFRPNAMIDLTADPAEIGDVAIIPDPFGGSFAN